MRLALAEHGRHGLERERPDQDEEQDEVERADDHPEQVDLEQRGVALGGKLCDVLARPGGDGQDFHDDLGRLDEDREQADDDREDAEAFGEGREDDRDAADLAGRVGVAADGGGRQAAEDADADARADNAEGCESGAV